MPCMFNAGFSSEGQHLGLPIPLLIFTQRVKTTYAGKGNIGVGGALFPPTDCKASFSFVFTLEALRFASAAATNTSATTALDTNFGHIYYLLFSYLGFVTFSSSPSSFHFLVSCLLTLYNRQSLALNEQY